VGADRADFVLPGCAVFEAIRRIWPATEVVVADRGLREGMLLRMMRQHHGGAGQLPVRRGWQARPLSRTALPA
jgi:exopolyphosphatase/guanosine-5'-triphosphate,3'-diphosphate pyrophosphatase